MTGSSTAGATALGASLVKTAPDSASSVIAFAASPWPTPPFVIAHHRASSFFGVLPESDSERRSRSELNKLRCGARASPRS